MRHDKILVELKLGDLLVKLMSIFKKILAAQQKSARIYEGTFFSFYLFLLELFNGRSETQLSQEIAFLFFLLLLLLSGTLL